MSEDPKDWLKFNPEDKNGPVDHDQYETLGSSALGGIPQEDQQGEVSIDEIIERINLLEAPGARAREFINQYRISGGLNILDLAYGELVGFKELNPKFSAEIRDKLATKGLAGIGEIELPNPDQTPGAIITDLAIEYARAKETSRALELAERRDDRFKAKYTELQLFIKVAELTGAPEAFNRAGEKLEEKNDWWMQIRYGTSSLDWRKFVKERGFIKEDEGLFQYHEHLEPEVAMLSKAYTQNEQFYDAYYFANKLKGLSLRCGAFRELADKSDNQEFKDEADILDIEFTLKEMPYTNLPPVEDRIFGGTFDPNFEEAYKKWKKANDTVKAATTKMLESYLDALHISRIENPVRRARFFSSNVHKRVRGSLRK
jgi:hypothetical protein